MVLLSNCTKSSTNVLKHWTVGYFVPKKKPVSLISCMYYASLSTLLFAPFKKCKGNIAVG